MQTKDEARQAARQEMAKQLIPLLEMAINADLGNEAWILSQFISALIGNTIGQLVKKLI